MRIWKGKSPGFTLVELMVVMAIMGVLAAIVVPAVSGTRQASKDAQVKSDASSVQSGTGSYNTNANTAELLTTTSDEDILTTTPTMIISNRWPEQNINAAYATEFPEARGTTSNTVAEVVVIGANKADGSAITALDDFAEYYNAVAFSELQSAGYIQAEPQGADDTFSDTKDYHNYLWLFKKVPSGSDDAGGRVLEVFKLTKIEASALAGSTDADKLTYEKVF